MNFEAAPKETETHTSWDEAKLYCAFLEVDGKNDWRLPTNEELKKIYQSKNDFTNDYYWSSTEDNDNNVGLAIGKLAWFQDMSNGYVYSGYKGNRAYIRAVRYI